MLSHVGLKVDPPQRPPVQVTKLPTTLFVFLRVPLTHLGRWFAFTIKIPRDYVCSLTIQQSCFINHISHITQTVLETHTSHWVTWCWEVYISALAGSRHCSSTVPNWNFTFISWKARCVVIECRTGSEWPLVERSYVSWTFGLKSRWTVDGFRCVHGLNRSFSSTLLFSPSQSANGY